MEDEARINEIINFDDYFKKQIKRFDLKGMGNKLGNFASKAGVKTTETCNNCWTEID